MSLEDFPLVDIGDIVRLVGPTSFQRGRVYSRNGSVDAVVWDHENGMLFGTVIGTQRDPYKCEIVLSPPGSPLRRPLNSSCTCPVGVDCKHVAATLLEANSIAIQHADDARIQRASDIRAAARKAVEPVQRVPRGGGGGGASVGTAGGSASRSMPGNSGSSGDFDSVLAPVNNVYPFFSETFPDEASDLGNSDDSAQFAEPAERAKSVPRWKKALEPLAPSELSAPFTSATTGRFTGARPLDNAEVPLALQFEVREVKPRRGRQWGPVATIPAIPLPEASLSRKLPVYRLGIRPVMRSDTGNWVRGNLNWTSVGYHGGYRFNAEQRLWFAQIAGLHTASNDFGYGPAPDWFFLDEFHSPLLWTLFEQAAQLGIPLVGSKKTATVEIAQGVDLSIDAASTGLVSAGQAKKGVAAPLELRPILTVDGVSRAVERAGTIGDHGIYTFDFAPRVLYTLVRTARPLTVEQRTFIGVAPTLAVPGRDVPEFLADYYPKLRRSITVTSNDASVRLPEFVPPVLVLTATFAPGHRLDLAWDWEYRTGDAADAENAEDTRNDKNTDNPRYTNNTQNTVTRRPLRPVEGEQGARDLTVERDIVSLVESAMAPLRNTGAAGLLDSAGHLNAIGEARGHAAALFTDKVLPGVTALPGVRVDIVGTKPHYEELTAAPELTISTAETDHRDWFDLGVTVTIEGRNVPFEPLFAALSTGEEQLILEDNSYLSLDQPVFADLKRLITEASTLQEWQTKPKLSRYQASLWSEFENLAANTEQAAAWRESVTGLLELGDVEPVPLPAGVHASLRPYQQDGFNWLVFLWKHQLGGVLADDMGLGKTLQTLALIAHAVDQRAIYQGALNQGAAGQGEAGPGAVNQARDDSGSKPFLVVAPTSVVSNWVSEAERFAPGLTVRGITTTQLKGRTPLAEVFAGADIVVTSYALFRLDFDRYQAAGWSGLILDEAQFAKNATSFAHRCAVELDAPFKLAITGTPMENSLTDLWSLFAIVAPGLFPSAKKFNDEYVKPIAKGDNSALVDRLRRRIRPLMMRRTKDLVAKDLPAKQEQVLSIELAPKHKKLYDTYLQRERKKLLGLMEDFDKNRFQVFRSLTLLRMLSLDASLVDDKYADIPSSKLDALFEQLEDVVAENHRALIFSQFTSFLKKAAERLDAEGIEYCYLDGSTLKRADVIAKFKNGTAPVFLISLKAGGFGLNLTEADYVFLLDPWWNPATEAQAVDRTHRIGQSKNVMVYRMIATGTIEEKVMALKETKSKLFDAVMDDDAVFSSALTADDIRGLLD
jgi:superfamily II DNA or RNA helicase